MNLDWGELGFKFRTDYLNVIRNIGNDIKFVSLISQYEKDPQTGL